MCPLTAAGAHSGGPRTVPVANVPLKGTPFLTNLSPTLEATGTTQGPVKRQVPGKWTQEVWREAQKLHF